ncbi:dihydrofolate reductase family protein [Kribbella sancticallisti]|uniref:Dihydrofolate reductase family protein n=1 Tax=Kribbella sancticallisti TaxID=460087 RepID=A0ABP4Q1N1_9ACTN
MRRIIHFVHTSLDGFIEGPNGEFDWAVMTGKLSKYSLGLVGQADTFLYGRVVWEMMSGYWPEVESMSTHEHDLAFAPVWRKTPKVVVSSSLEQADWNTTVVNTVEAVGELKQQPGGDILLTGGSTLAASLEDSGLLDERRIVVHPVLLGAGKRLFPENRKRRSVTLIESRPLDEHAVLLRHSLI